jgi:hypothetical protein
MLRLHSGRSKFARNKAIESGDMAVVLVLGNFSTGNTGLLLLFECLSWELSIDTFIIDNDFMHLTLSIKQD